MQNDTCKNKTKSVKPRNKSKSLTWEMKIREKKVTLLTRKRANFTRSATLTFKRLSAKTKIFFNLFGNFFEALAIFSQFFSLSEKDSSIYRLSNSGKLRSNFVSVIRYPIFPDGMLTWNPMEKKQVSELVWPGGR